MSSSESIPLFKPTLQKYYTVLVTFMIDQHQTKVNLQYRLNKNNTGSSMPPLQPTTSLPISASTPKHTPSNPQHHHDEKQTLKKLIEVNSAYLHQKVKVQEVPKPSPFTYKLPSKTGHSQYSRNYKSAPRHINLSFSNTKQSTPVSHLKMAQTPVPGYASTYTIDYRQRAVTEAHDNGTPCSKKLQYRPSDAPSFNETSYNRDFPNKGIAHAQSAKRAEVKLMGGGKLNSNTTYGHSFRAKTLDSQNAPVKHKNNNIFVKVDKPSWTSYQQNFKQRKRRNKQESCKPKQQYIPLASNCKYQTEYAGVYRGTPVSSKRDFDCLSPSQLKKYVMGILDY